MHVFSQVLCRGLLEYPFGPYSVEFCLPHPLDLKSKVLLRFLEIACSSSLDKSLSEDDFVDVPDSTAFIESWRSFASHGLSPLG